MHQLAHLSSDLDQMLQTHGLDPEDFRNVLVLSFLCNLVFRAKGLFVVFLAFLPVLMVSVPHGLSVIKRAATVGWECITRDLRLLLVFLVSCVAVDMELFAKLNIGWAALLLLHFAREMMWRRRGPEPVEDDASA